MNLGGDSLSEESKLHWPRRIAFKAITIGERGQRAAELNSTETKDSRKALRAGEMWGDLRPPEFALSFTQRTCIFLIITTGERGALSSLVMAFQRDGSQVFEKDISG